MSDEAPLFFERRLGGLFPASPAAEAALATVTGKVRVKLTRTHGNNKRMSLYWIVLGLVAPMLSEQIDGDAIDDRMLHRILKKRRGLVKVITLPSGDTIEDFDSISFATMDEAERAAFIDWSFATLSKWLGVPVETLTKEAEAA